MPPKDISPSANSGRADVIVPTNRLDRITRFLDAWKDEFAGHHVTVVEDSPQRTFDLRRWGVEHYSWKEIDDELGKNSWIIPRRTDCIRSFGFLKGWQRNSDFIVSLDDDCLPVSRGFLSEHWKMLNTPASLSAWVSTVEGAMPRGVPYFAKDRTGECVLNHGLWKGVPDYDALTQLHASRQPLHVAPVDQVIPRGVYFPMCGMNLAFKAELVPILYFLLMGRDWPYDRFGDIWCGIFVKRICDHLGHGIRSGQPLVCHERASDVWSNLKKEAPAYEVNERLWQVVNSLVLAGESFVECYHELANQLILPGDYWARLRTAMHLWADLFTQPRVCRSSSALVKEAAGA